MSVQNDEDLERLLRAEDDDNSDIIKKSEEYSQADFKKSLILTIICAGSIIFALFLLYLIIMKFTNIGV